MQTNPIAIIGLGYVGLPLAIAFSEQYNVIGFDTDRQRIHELSQDLLDRTGEFSGPELAQVQQTGTLQFSDEEDILAKATVFIITVPTPVDAHKLPDLGPLLAATNTVARYLKPGDLVIYESTVYPGCTEEECVPVLEQVSGLRYNADFFCGYSPERINVGDNRYKLKDIIKITSGSNAEASERVAALYQSVITAGIYTAGSIKVAEAAKVVENAQRDLNISFVNELALIFDKLDIDTGQVLDAAATKWNFLNFRPGLVGGHCIGVDPYYLTYKASQIGYQPRVISSGRMVNEEMSGFIASKLERLLYQLRNRHLSASRVLLLGVTFKENCRDTRNSGVVRLYQELIQRGVQVDVFDPLADKHIVQEEYSIPLQPKIDYANNYDIVVLAVAHSIFEEITYQEFKRKDTLIFDIKGFLPPALVDGRL
jgi:UDP-N-acetyl-D-galactosamine dehydrogenase